MFTTRDWLWLTALVGMAIGWWVQASWPTKPIVGQPVYMVRYEPITDSVKVTRGIVSSVAPQRFAIDTCCSPPISEGVVITRSGECLGLIGSESRQRMFAVPLPALPER